MNTVGLFSQNTFSDNLERLHALSRMPKAEWLDMLGLSWQKYYQYKIGISEFPSSSLRQLSNHFQVAEENIVEGYIDFQKLEMLSEQQDLHERFLVGAHGRRRTTITSIEYLEKAFGWRLRYDVMNHFQVSTSALQDPFATISIRFITEMAEYLKKRQFKQADFYRMGMYSAEGNRQSLIGKIFSEMENLEQAYNMFLNKTIFIFENNCTYNYQQITEKTGLVTVHSTPDVAAELKVKHLGSESICELKAGMFASLPSYMGLNNAKVTHFTCEHRGDDACRFHVDQTPCTPRTTTLSD